jgi:hypothetical protein
MSNISANQAKKLAAIAEATNDPARGFVYMTEKSVKVLLDAGLVECNNAMQDGNGNVAVRATKAGIDALASPVEPETNEGTEIMDTPAATAAPFAIEDGVKIPSIKRSGAAASIYPFDKLAVGQSFFVPATEAMPNPGKSLASTVSSASKRYATENGTREINRKVDGVMTKVTVPAYEYERKFVVRSVEENGVKGARVWRVEPADHADGDEDGEGSEE